MRQSLEEIWLGKIADEVRNQVALGRIHVMCSNASCPELVRGDLPSFGGDGTFPVPQLLEIDLPNTHCNFGGAKPTESNPACIMCERAQPGYQFQSDRDFSRVLPLLVPLVPFSRNIHIQGTAEPFWRGTIFDVLEMLHFAPHRSRTQVSTVTNGTLFDDETQERFLEACDLSSVSVSVDASNSTTYNKIRRHNVFELVVKNIESYSRKRRRKKKAYLRIFNNINLLNLDEVEEMVELADSLGADIVEFNPTWGQPAEVLVSAENAHRFRVAQLKILVRAKKKKVRVQFLRPLDLNLFVQSDRAIHL